jgi:hypothetical protein
LSISGSIKSLLLGGINILNQLNEDFFKALGENKTLENLILDMDQVAYTNSCHNNYYLLA